ncbi:MAG TPA: sphingomyelin phosphodiesterase [Bacteriovoracaceae bacterium]|nr:sphingomyelin phosphodiesterase [Bacteriovoracaceae bacterium]
MRLLFLLLLLLPMTALAQEIKLLSWNVYMIPKPILFTKQGIRTSLIIKELLKTDHDVVVLQEAFSPVFRMRAYSKLKHKYPYRQLLKRGAGVKFLNSGIFILSRYPYKLLSTYNYLRCSGIDCFAAKGALLFEVQHPSGKRLQIVTSHLQAETTIAAQTARAHQFQNIKDMLDKHREVGVPQIMAGDVNVEGRDGNGAEYLNLLNTLQMTSGPLSGDLDHTADYPVDCYKIISTYKKTLLDHILISENGSDAQVTHRKVLPFLVKFKYKVCPLSDHYGLEAIIKL